MIPFIKMHGLGNDFVVLDLRAGIAAPDVAAARMIADRRRGIGCDQLILIEPAGLPGADVRLRFLNADGSESGACGNGTRCVASRLIGESGANRLVIETKAGRLEATPAAAGEFTVDMGPAHLDWRDIPLAHEINTLHLDIALGPLEDPAAVNMGNPHCIFFVDDAEDIELAVDNGCSFFDTAWGYGAGHSEGLLGQLVRANPDKKLYTATKIPPKNFIWPSRREFSVEDCFPPDHIEDARSRVTQQ